MPIQKLLEMVVDLFVSLVNLAIHLYLSIQLGASNWSRVQAIVSEGLLFLISSELKINKGGYFSLILTLKNIYCSLYMASIWCPLIRLIFNSRCLSNICFFFLLNLNKIQIQLFQNSNDFYYDGMNGGGILVSY